MINVEHGDPAIGLVDFVDDSIRANAGCMKPRRVCPQRATHAVWIIQQPPEDELEHGRSDLARESLQTPVGRPRHLQ